MKSCSELEAQTRQCAGLEKDWDSYGADPPNIISVGKTLSVLKEMQSRLIEASAVVPDASGGLGIVWARPGKYAALEVLNDGTVSGVVSNHHVGGDMKIWYVDELTPLSAREDIEPGALYLTLPESLEFIRTFMWAIYD